MSIQATRPVLDPPRVWQPQRIGSSTQKQSLGRALAYRLNRWWCQDALLETPRTVSLLLIPTAARRFTDSLSPIPPPYSSGPTSRRSGTPAHKRRVYTT